jgi:hypothetical protein
VDWLTLLLVIWIGRGSISADGLTLYVASFVWMTKVGISLTLLYWVGLRCPRLEGRRMKERLEQESRSQCFRTMGVLNRTTRLS